MATEEQVKDFLAGCNCCTDKTYFTVSWGPIGCMPDHSSIGYETFEEAKEALIEELKDREFMAGDLMEDNEEEAEAYCHMAEEANLLNKAELENVSPGPGVIGWGMHFFITKDEAEANRDEYSDSQCDCCRTSLIGARLHMEGYHPEKKEIMDLGVVCEECRYELEYGAGSFES